PWLLATLGIAHLVAAGGAALPGTGGPLTVGLDAAIVLGVGVVLVKGRRRATGMPFQAAAVVLIVLAALASGVRAASTAHLVDGADVVLAVLAAVGLRSRRVCAAGTVGAAAVWTAAAITGAAVSTASLRPAASDWLLLGTLAVTATIASAGLRMALASMRDAFESATRLAQLHAVTDPLTAAHNRRGLELMAVPMIEHARRQGEAVHCLFIDLDEFRVVNEQLSRSHGDEVLDAVCQALLASIRATDAVARWAGDQFVIVGPGTGVSPLEMERRVRSLLAGDPPVPTEVWNGRVSIGSATLVPWDEGNLDSLLGRAEEDMQLRRSLRRQSADRARSAHGGFGQAGNGSNGTPTVPPNTPPATPPVSHDH
ncbi:MAG TPA: GGDEF domain-containing protein, partial [Kineosporiaceae bacterium]|nr:GGDEF domain-containing protein [Kineosporiaceae bacterium]